MRTRYYKQFTSDRRIISISEKALRIELKPYYTETETMIAYLQAGNFSREKPLITPIATYWAI